MKIVRKRLADGTVKTYQYPNYRGARHQHVTRRVAAEAHEVMRACGLSSAPVFIYFMQAASGPIKIGITDHVARRFQNVSQNAFEEVRLLALFKGSRDLEKRLHNSLARHRLKNDWFAPHEHVLRAITDLQRDRRIRVNRQAGKLTGNQKTDDPQVVAM